VAADFFVRLQREGYHGDEAECEPFPGGGLVSENCVSLLAEVGGKEVGRKEEGGRGKGDRKGENVEGRERKTYQRLYTWPDMFPQFWHCTVRFPASWRRLVKVCVPQVKKKNILSWLLCVLGPSTSVCSGG
jgi:hypothetical protein